MTEIILIQTTVFGNKQQQTVNTRELRHGEHRYQSVDGKKLTTQVRITPKGMATLAKKAKATV